MPDTRQVRAPPRREGGPGIAAPPCARGSLHRGAPRTPDGRRPPRRGYRRGRTEAARRRPSRGFRALFAKVDPWRGPRSLEAPYQAARRGRTREARQRTAVAQWDARSPRRMPGGALQVATHLTGAPLRSRAADAPSLGALASAWARRAGVRRRMGPD